MALSVKRSRANRATARQSSHPRGEPAGMPAVIYGAAKKIGLDPVSLLDWKIYPEAVALISADGRKFVMCVAENDDGSEVL